MKKIILALLFMMSSNCHAIWRGHLDLQPSAQPLGFRELDQGQWLAGLAHPNLWHLNHDNNIILHAGLFQAWDADHGGASFGPLLGADLVGISKDVGLDIPLIIATIGNNLGVPTIFKPAAWFTAMTSFDLFAGYRPIHQDDVRGDFVFGLGACLNVPFGIGELRQGL